MIRNDENLKDSTLPLLIHPQAEARGQVQLCQNLIINLFEKGDSPCTKKFPDVKTKNNFLSTISKAYLDSHHKMESTQRKSITKQVSTEYIKHMQQNQNSQRANSIFTNDVISLIICLSVNITLMFNFYSGSLRMAGFIQKEIHITYIN